MILFYFCLISLLFLLFLNRILEHLLKRFLKFLQFKISIPSLSCFERISFVIKQNFSFIKYAKISISQIKLIKVPNKFEFFLKINKIHIKSELNQLNLIPIRKNEMEEIFATNLLKIFEFTNKSLLKKGELLKKLKKKNEKPNINTNSFNDFLLPLKMMMKFLLLAVITRIKFKIEKITFEILESITDDSNENNEFDMFDDIVLKIRYYNTNISFQYNELVKLKN